MSDRRGIPRVAGSACGAAAGRALSASQSCHPLLGPRKNNPRRTFYLRKAKNSPLLLIVHGHTLADSSSFPISFSRSPIPLRQNASGQLPC